MHIYFSTFIPGLGEVVASALKQNLADGKIIKIVDGLIIYQTDKSPDVVRKLAFFSNTFVLLKKFATSSTSQMFEQAIKDKTLASNLEKYVMHQRISFRIIAKEESLISIDPRLLMQLEKKFTQVKKLGVNRSKPDIELWFLQRREGFGVFGLRITRHPDYHKILQKGELRPELAHLLYLLSEPNHKDIFLDPFAGWGAIPFARTQYQYNTITAIDTDQKRLAYLAQKTKKSKKKIEIATADFLKHNILEKSIDKIVTVINLS